MWRYWIFVGSLGKWRRLIPPDEVNLADFADVHPETGNTWKRRARAVRGEPKKFLVKLEISGQSGFITVNSYPLMMDFDNSNCHVLFSRSSWTLIGVECVSPKCFPGKNLVSARFLGAQGIPTLPPGYD